MELESRGDLTDAAPAFQGQPGPGSDGVYTGGVSPTFVAGHDGQALDMRSVGNNYVRTGTYLDGDPATITSTQKTRTKQMAMTPLSLLNCPTRRRPQLYAAPGGLQGYNCEDTKTAARNDYAVNHGDFRWSGNLPGPATLAEGDGTAFWAGSDADRTKATGISHVLSQVTMANIRDGSSNTLMIGEKALEPEYYTSGTRLDDNRGMYQGEDYDTGRWTHIKPMQDGCGYDSRDLFGSSHAGAVNFALCDGSVRPISYSINTDTYRWLGNRASGKSIDASQF